MPRLLLIALLVAGSASFAAQPTSAPTVKPEDLPRVPPTEPGDAIKKFSVRPGFHVELVASEPNLASPIALCFDENGRMFVCEMIDYSERRAEKLGRIRMLEDLDGDGFYEKSTVFLKGLPWPTAVMWINGGVLVGACPDIIFARDTDNDGVADESKILFTGFGAGQDRLNVQGLFNNFQWGLDNRIHGCSGTVGGLVKSVPANGSPAAPPREEPLDVRGKGFVIDPRDWSMTTEAGGGQYGLSFDHTGRLFTCSNSVHIETFMYDIRYAARNPYIALPESRICPAVDGGAAEVFRTSPEEPWRVIRTRWRIAGLVSGPIEGGGRSAGYFTGATGVTIYRGDAFGDDYVGDAFTGDAGGNLVHHKRLSLAKDGLSPVAQRPDDERKIEFVASSDNWFRPVDFANAADGTLYICDMYRETIEHPWSLPPQIKQYLDLNSGNDRGRIWRIAPDGFKPRGASRFSGTAIPDLVKLLEHPNGWHRETASRLLFERRDTTATPMLVELLQNSSSSMARLHALHALDGLDALSEPHIIHTLADPDPIVREHAIKLSERYLAPPTPQLWSALAHLADDPNPRVRLQLAFTLGDAKHPDRAKLLATIARRDVENPWMRVAILSSSTDIADTLFDELAHDQPPSRILIVPVFLRELALIVGQAGNAAAKQRVASIVRSSPNCFELAAGLAEGIARQHGSVKDFPDLMAVLESAAGFASSVDAQPPPQALRSVIALLSYLEYDNVKSTLVGLLARRGQTAALAAIATLERFDDPRVATDTLAEWPDLSPRVRIELVSMLARRPAHAAALLDAIESKQLSPTDIDATQAEQLRRHSNPAVRTRAAKLLPSPSTQRDQVVEAFRPALALTGEASKGRVLYAARCVSCHRADGEGALLGPDFVTVKNSGREKLLLNILDPSREVQPQFVSFLIETKDAQDVLGVVVADTPTSITIRQAYGKEVTIARSNIKRMTSQGRSLMPDGLETGLQPQDVADLLAFIESIEK